MESHQQDLYLLANIAMKESSTPPTAGSALDPLLRIAHAMQDTPFQYAFVDKPKAGTCSIVYRDGQARSNWPSDGVRYAQPAENVARQAVPLPSGQQVEVETSMISQGIFPPSNPNAPLALDTPELTLGRYRLRYRIVTPGIGNPNLFLVYWGRDPNANIRCPAGWERECIRRYPLPNFPSQSVFPLKIPNPAAAQQPSNQLSAAAIAQQQSLMQQRMLNSASGQANQAAQGRPATGQAQLPSISAPRMPNGAVTNGVADMQNLRSAGALTHAAQPGFPALQAKGQIPPSAMMQQLPQNVPPALAAQYAAQQRQLQMQAAAMASRNGAGVNGMAAAGVQAGRPGTGNIPPMLSMQQQAQAQAAAIVTQQQVQQIAQIRALVNHFPFPVPFNDDFEILSDRTRAGMRYETNHKLIAPIFDAFTTTDLLTTWKNPPQIDLEGVKAQIKSLEADIAKLRSKSDPSITSLASAELLAPLPKMMPVAQMREAALQADALRRAAVEQAQQAAEEEAKQQREAEVARLAAAQAAERERQMADMKREQLRYHSNTVESGQANGVIADPGQTTLVQGSSKNPAAHSNSLTFATAVDQQALPPSASGQDNGFQLLESHVPSQGALPDQRSGNVLNQNGQDRTLPPVAHDASDGARLANAAQPDLQVSTSQFEIPSNNGSQFGEGDDSFLFNDNFGNYDGKQFEETMFDELEYLTQMQE